MLASLTVRSACFVSINKNTRRFKGGRYAMLLRVLLGEMAVLASGITNRIGQSPAGGRTDRVRTTEAAEDASMRIVPFQSKAPHAVILGAQRV